MSSKTIVMIEAFYGGSHKQLVDLIFNLVLDKAELYTLPAKKWHWRSITSALHFAQVIPTKHNFSVLFTSSVLPLAELTALRPDLAQLHKIVYFHENQMVYPVREKKSRYFHHGFNEVMTSLVANTVLFNSKFNKETFLKNISSFFNVMPDYKPKNLESLIRPKCSVLPFPLLLRENISQTNSDQISKSILETNNLFSDDNFIQPSVLNEDNKLEIKTDKVHILWPHRWEHDKDPETFFSIMFKLKNIGAEFYLSVLGESFTEKPDIFEEAKHKLKENIIHWGYRESREEYFNVLHSADIVVSTAKHEFFGVSMLEATSLNCYPLCPKTLVYPEIYPDEYLYNTPNQLYKKLKYFCEHPYVIRNHELKVDVSKFSWDTLLPEYKKLFEDTGEKTKSS